jgi:hypothetical protein
MTGRQGEGSLTSLGAEVTQDALLDALGRLLASGGRMKLYGTGKSPALWVSRTAASQRLVHELTIRGFVALDDPHSGSCQCTLTELGRAWLLGAQSPRLLLEDLLRASEAACQQLRNLETACRAQCQQLERLQGDIARVLDRVEASHGQSRVDSEIERLLERRQQASQVGACSLGDLFAALRQELPTLTVGQFHDRLRAMHENGRLRLMPWTGPLYQLPEPPLALLVGHEVLYYVQLVDKRAA